MDLTKKLSGTALFLFAVTSFSQALLPIAVPKSKWINSYFEQVKGEGESASDHKRLVTAEEFCVLKEDSTINGINYLVVDDCKGTYVGALRDHEGLLLFVPRDGKEESTVYDFTASEGQIIKNVLSRTSDGKYVHQDIVVKSVDSTLIGGETRKRINYRGGSWIEGLGCTHGLFMSHESSTRYIEVLTCMCNGEVTQYPNKKKKRCALPTDLNRAMSNFTDIITVKPSRGWFVMQFDRRVDKDEVIIIDSEGRLIKPNMTIRPDRILVDLSAYKNGNYVILLRNKESMTLGRLEKI
jgi:hypothetical protein